MTEAPPTSPELTDEEISEQKAVRLGKRERLIAAADDAGGGAYPVQVPVTTTIPAVREAWGHLAADEASGEMVGVAGRVVHLRNTGKLCFVTLQSGDGTRLQGMLSQKVVGAERLEDWKSDVDLGDHVFLHGNVIKSKRGELSVMVDEWAIAAKALRPLPVAHKPLSEESRVRQRYVDLLEVMAQDPRVAEYRRKLMTRLY